MARRLGPSLFLLILALPLLGCRGGRIDPVQLPDGAPTRAESHSQAGQQWVAGRFQLTLDPVAMTANAEPVVDRAAQAQPPQGLTFDLDPANFLTAEGFQVTGVALDPEGDYVISFTHAHPYAAPDLALPDSATNRADLSYTGRLMLQATASPQLFFGGAVRLSPGVIKDADGYRHPGDLLLWPNHLIVNVYPYVLLADDGEDNRFGVSNGGDPKGNYAAPLGGWQRGNIGPDGDRWTGFDFVHAGQQITNTFTIRKEALAGGNFQMGVALLIKYTQPKGQGGPTFRFPPAATDVSQFAYRLPYAALDASQVSVPGAPYVLSTTAGSSLNIPVRVRDWDGAADEAPGATVGDQSDVSLIPAGTAGAPTGRIDVPALSGTQWALSLTPGATGQPGDEFQYTRAFSNQLGTAPAGRIYGLLEFEDPEALITDDYHYGLDAETLVADLGRALVARTYQVVPFDLTDPIAAPAVLSVSPGGIVGRTGDPLQFSALTQGTISSWNWNFGGGATPNTSSLPNPSQTLSFTPGIYTGTLTVSGPGGGAAPFEFAYRVDAIPAPNWEHSVFYDAPTEGRAVVADRQGIPVVVYQNEGADYVIYCAVAKVPTPRTPFDWTRGTVAIDPVIFTGVQLLTIDDRILITAKSPSALIQVWQTTSPAPTVEGDWATHTTLGGVSARSMSLVRHADQVALLFFAGADGDPFLLHSIVPLPLSGADWDFHQIEDISTPAFDRPQLASIGGRLVAVYREVSGKLRVAHAQVSLPDESEDWLAYDLHVDTDTTSEVLLDAGGRPLVVYTDLGPPIARVRVCVPQVAYPAALADWDQYDLGTWDYGIFDQMHATVASGVPVIALHTFDGTAGVVHVYRGLSTLPSGPEQWTWGSVDGLSGALLTPSLHQIGGRLFLADLVGGILHTAQTTAPW